MTSADSRQTITLVGLMGLSGILGMAGFATFPALLPTFYGAWSLSDTEAGWINGIFFAGYTGAVPVLVSLTDRVDPRRVYLGAMFLAAIASLGFAFFAEGVATAMVFRALAGVGLAGTYMPGLKLLTDHVAAHHESRTLAYYTVHFSIGISLSYVIAGWLAEDLGWRWTFGLTAFGPLAAMAVVFLLVPAGRKIEQRPDSHLLDFRPVLANRPVMAYVVGYAGHNWELFGLRSWLVAYLVFSQSLQGADTTGAGWSATTIAALLALLAPPASVLGNEAAERFGRRRLLIAVMGASAVVCLAVGAAAPLPFMVVVVLCVLHSVTVSADSAALTAGALAAAARTRRGAAMAVHSTIGFLGGFAGPLAIGVVLDLAGGNQSPFAWAVAFGAMGLGVALGAAVLYFYGARRD